LESHERENALVCGESEDCFLRNIASFKADRRLKTKSLSMTSVLSSLQKTLKNSLVKACDRRRLLHSLRSFLPY
jgi:hypothetical protein